MSLAVQEAIDMWNTIVAKEGGTVKIKSEGVLLILCAKDGA